MLLGVDEFRTVQASWRVVYGYDHLYLYRWFYCYEKLVLIINTASYN